MGAPGLLTIRNVQLTALTALRRTSFELAAVDHLLEHFPERFASDTPEQLESFVAHGIERAKVHGFIAKADVVLYLDLMAVLGRTFDEDAQSRWVLPRLEDKQRPPGLRIRRLFREVLARLEAT
jgi:hypothetical protein